jgi:hypothetical protein
MLRCLIPDYAAAAAAALNLILPKQLAAEQDGVRYNASGALQSLLESCLTPSLVAALQQQGSSSSSRGGIAPLTSLVAAVASGLGARYQEAWGLALPGMFELCFFFGVTSVCDVQVLCVQPWEITIIRTSSSACVQRKHYVQQAHWHISLLQEVRSVVACGHFFIFCCLCAATLLFATALLQSLECSVRSLQLAVQQLLLRQS